MTTIYIRDTTLTPAQEKQFNNYPQAVKYMEGMSVRAYGQNRRQRMIMLEELGHGADDANAVTFVRTMAQAFEMGVVRDGAHLPCDISTIMLYQKPEYGD